MMNCYSELNLLLRLGFWGQEQPTLVDVGAHVGSFARPFAARNWRVIAFEPETTNYAELRRRLGGYPGVICVQKAVADAPQGHVPFYTSAEHWGIHSLKPFHPTHQLRQEVETVRLDDALRGLGITQVDLLKIDIEGADLLALKGFDLAEMRPAVIVSEFMDSRSQPNFGYTHHDIVEHVRPFGYTCFVSEWAPISAYGREGVVSEPHRFIRCAPYRREGAPAWGNLIFVPSERGVAFRDSLALYIRSLRRPATTGLLRAAVGFAERTPIVGAPLRRALHFCKRREP